MSLSGLIWIPTRALVLLGWFFTRRALRSTSTPKRGSQVRTGPFAGGSRIRTIGPAEDPRRRRDIGSRRAAFSVAASRADTSPSLETLVVSRGTDGSIRLVRAVRQTNSGGCGVGGVRCGHRAAPRAANRSYEKLTAAKACCHFLCRYPCMPGDRHELPA